MPARHAFVSKITDDPDVGQVKPQDWNRDHVLEVNLESEVFNVLPAANGGFSNEAVDDRVAALIQNGTGITWTYNDALNTLTANLPQNIATTSTPTFAGLTISNTSNLLVSLVTNQSIAYENLSNGTATVQWGTDSATTAFIGTLSAHDFGIYTSRAVNALPAILARTNNNVGIGVTPNNRLTVSNTAATTVADFIGGTTSAKIDVKSSTTTGFFQSNGASAKIQLGSAADIPVAISINGSDQATFNSTGLGLGGVPANRFLSAISNSNTAAFQAAAQEAIRLQNTNNTNNNWTSLALYSQAGSVAAGISAQNVDQTNSYADIVLHTRSAAGFSEKARLTAAGKLGIGVTPIATLHVADATNPTTFTVGVNSGTGGYTALITELSAVSGGYVNMQPISAAGTSYGNLVLARDGGGVCVAGTTLDANYVLQLPNSATKKAKANAWDTYSDARLKQNVKRIDGALNKVCALNGYYYNWKPEAVLQIRYDEYHEQIAPTQEDLDLLAKDTARLNAGGIAQEWAEHVPEIVTRDEEGVATAINYGGLTPFLVESIKELKAQVDQLTAKLNALTT